MPVEARLVFAKRLCVESVVPGFASAFVFVLIACGLCGRTADV
jgi:hypothetical protein